MLRRTIALYTQYFIATEYLECNRCHKKLPAYDRRIMSQLDPAKQAQFPATLTRKLAIDNALLALLNDRGLGNSACQFQRKLLESHSTHHLKQIRL